MVGEPSKGQTGDRVTPGKKCVLPNVDDIQLSGEGDGWIQALAVVFSSGCHVYVDSLCLVICGIPQCVEDQL